MGPQLDGPVLAHHVQHRHALLPLLSLLAKPAAEVDDVVRQALDANPMLVRLPGGPCVGCGRHSSPGPFCRECRLQRVDGRLRAASDWRLQLEMDARLELPSSRFGLLARVVGSLTDEGLLPRDGEDSAELEKVLAALRLVGPGGIGARTPSDCVSLQLVALADSGRLPSWAASLSLVDLAAAIRGEGADAVVALAPLIVSLVHPGVETGVGSALRVPPDVRFRLIDGRVVVEVMDVDWYGLAVDDSLYSQLAGEARTWLRPHRQQARELLGFLAARAGMLRRLAEWLAEQQRDFLVHGPAHHRPLTRAAAARALSCHPTTVGRAVARKTARCPDGRMVPLASCFGGRTAVLEALRQLAWSTPAATDEQLANQLCLIGYVIGRRTVTKYRHLLGIPAYRGEPSFA